MSLNLPVFKYPHGVNPSTKRKQKKLKLKFKNIGIINYDIDFNKWRQLRPLLRTVKKKYEAAKPIPIVPTPTGPAPKWPTPTIPIPKVAKKRPPTPYYPFSNNAPLGIVDSNGNINSTSDVPLNFPLDTYNYPVATTSQQKEVPKKKKKEEEEIAYPVEAATNREGNPVDQNLPPPPPDEPPYGPPPRQPPKFFINFRPLAAAVTALAAIRFNQMDNQVQGFLEAEENEGEDELVELTWDEINALNEMTQDVPSLNVEVQNISWAIEDDAESLDDADSEMDVVNWHEEEKYHMPQGLAEFYAIARTTYITPSPSPELHIPQQMFQSQPDEVVGYININDTLQPVYQVIDSNYQRVNIREPQGTVNFPQQHGMIQEEEEYETIEPIRESQQLTYQVEDNNVNNVTVGEQRPINVPQQHGMIQEEEEENFEGIAPEFHAEHTTQNALSRIQQKYKNENKVDVDRVIQMQYPQQSQLINEEEELLEELAELPQQIAPSELQGTYDINNANVSSRPSMLQLPQQSTLTTEEEEVGKVPEYFEWQVRQHTQQPYHNRKQINQYLHEILHAPATSSVVQEEEAENFESIAPQTASTIDNDFVIEPPVNWSIQESQVKKEIPKRPKLDMSGLDAMLAQLQSQTAPESRLVESLRQNEAAATVPPPPPQGQNSEDILRNLALGSLLWSTSSLLNKK
jgi:hypothetical protein